MNSLQRTFQVARVLSRQYGSQSTKDVVWKNSKNLKEIQARFQCDDGLPVFLKNGVKDKIWYQATLVMILVGTVMSLKVYYTLAKPK